MKTVVLPSARRAARVVTWLVLAAAIVWLWPAALGGSTSFVVVHGSSMEPTFHAGDLLVARSTDELGVGDIVLYQVPDGEVGEQRLVIHRLVDANVDGTFVMQGDNRAAPDPWVVDPADVVGAPELHVPKAGLLVEAMLSWFGLALVAAGLVAWVLWPSDDTQDPIEPAAPSPTTA
jgi:signal peptidase I